MAAKTYILKVSYTLNKTTYPAGETIIIDTVFKGTNSKNRNYLPEDLVELMKDQGIIAEKKPSASTVGLRKARGAS